MRRGLIVLVVLLGLAAGTTALPGPAVCSGSCVILAHGGGYVPPAVVVEDGSAVSWLSLDVGHINTDGIGLVDAAEPCLFESYSATRPSGAVTFGIVDDALMATDSEGTVRACGNAQPAGDGFVLPYWCVLHPAMRGELYVA